MIFGLVKTPDPKSLISGTSHISIRLFNKTFFEIVPAVPEILRYTHTDSYFAKYVRKPFRYSSCFRKVRGVGKKVCGQYSTPILGFFPT